MLSEKQKSILAFPYTKYQTLVCDGAVRSGKTSLMMVAFIDWAMDNYSNTRFGICGKTVDSTTKNIIAPYIGMSRTKEKYRTRWRRTDKLLEVSRGGVTNWFEVFGGKDESSFMLIQGRTFAGVLLDEVALMPRSFVEQALARCSVAGTRFWFSCNPGSPKHWFYQEWIKDPKVHNVLYLHFRMEDNPSLTQETLDLYRSTYRGVFYQRYILGLWVVAEGLIYDFGEDNITDETPRGAEYYISVDYGTLNPFSAGLWAVTGARAVRIREYYYDGRKRQRQLTDEEYCQEIKTLAAGLPITKVVVDPSAASFITALKRKGFRVQQADNAVLDGIRRTAGYLRNGNIKIHRSCVDAIQEFGMYRWNEEKNEDTVIKENDHAMDDIRYFCNTIMQRKVRDVV